MTTLFCEGMNMANLSRKIEEVSLTPYGVAKQKYHGISVCSW
ncbi:hypothetical protein [Jeotgalibacillus marinus]|uniref:Uncharacterized protein n=1 Tax=Jeotgalibacillus marinus TaxID=86667 RepID=A0ABV3Q692_9BACL